MKGFHARYSAPISTARPRASRLIEAYSPKLGRRIQLFDHATFAVWIGLEAAPSVTSLCERPARLGGAANDPVIDFWVRHDGVEQFLNVASDGDARTRPDHVDGIPLRLVRPPIVLPPASGSPTGNACCRSSMRRERLFPDR